MAVAWNVSAGSIMWPEKKLFQPVARRGEFVRDGVEKLLEVRLRLVDGFVGAFPKLSANVGE
jgi:hypothetical protein